MEIRKVALLECVFTVVFSAPSLHAQQSAASPKPEASATGNQQKALVAQGKGRFSAYKCYDCHGENGEGTADAPDLTHSKLTADQVSKFLQKPSVDAQNKGMPDVPVDNPDHKPLVAYVMSLRASGTQQSTAPASTPSSPATASKASTAARKASSPAAGGQQASLVAQGKARFSAYKCYDCHGENGEGTADAPDLTHSKLTADQVSKFLQKPSVDAQNKGMPDVPVDSPDHKPLVAYVMSLRAK